VDALGINGSEMTDLEAWWPSVRPSLLNHATPALIIVSFGTNDMGAKGFDEAAYRETSMRVLRSLRADAPGAAVLVTAPFDRGGKSRKNRSLMQERSQRATAALRDAARETGCAFWDAREAMGGAGSMPRWASARLAQRDQVHLTEPGYRQMAHYLFDALMKGYDGAPPPPAPSHE
jgi:lysophospholipase L1-like esterase